MLDVHAIVHIQYQGPYVRTYVRMYWSTHIRTFIQHYRIIPFTEHVYLSSLQVFDLLHNKKKLRVLEDGKAQVQVCFYIRTYVCTDNLYYYILKKLNTASTRHFRAHMCVPIYVRTVHTSVNVRTCLLVFYHHDKWLVKPGFYCRY